MYLCTYHHWYVAPRISMTYDYDYIGTSLHLSFEVSEVRSVWCVTIDTDVKDTASHSPPMV